MSVAPSDLILFAGGDCLERYGVLVKRTSPREEVPEVFTRASTGLYVARGGVLKSAAVDVPRVTYPAPDFDEAHWLLEGGARTNLVKESENLTDADWSNVGTPTEGTPYAASGVSLDLLGDNDVGAAEGKSQVVAFTGDAVKAISVFVKEGATPPASGSQIILRDTTAGADRLLATVTWAAGVPSVAMTTGTELQDPELIADGVYRLWLATTAVTAASTNQIELYPGRKGTVGDTGDIYIGGVQAENALFPSSYVKTTVASATRAAEVLYLPFPAIPQAMTGYFRFIERGTLLVSGARVAQIGLTGATTDPRLVVSASGGGKYEATHDNGTDAAVVSTLTGTAPTTGQLVELRVVLGADGSVQIHQSIAEATETSATASGAPALGLEDAWAGPRLYVGSDPAGGNGGPSSFRSVKIARGTYSLADMRAAV